MIYLINRSNLKDLYPKMSKGLLRAFEKTDLGSFWSMEDLLNHIINDEVIVFGQEASDFFGVLQTSHSPRNKILSFFWSGQDPANTTPIDFDEVDAFLTHVARQLQCGVIQCDGRLGWTPIMRARGYSLDSALFTRKVTDEPPTV